MEHCLAGHPSFRKLEVQNNEKFVEGFLVALQCASVSHGDNFFPNYDNSIFYSLRAQHQW